MREKYQRNLSLPVLRALFTVCALNKMTYGQRLSSCYPAYPYVKINGQQVVLQVVILWNVDLRSICPSFSKLRFLYRFSVPMSTRAFLQF